MSDPCPQAVATADTRETKEMLVAGDLFVDRHIYTGFRETPISDTRPGVILKNNGGGAALLHRLIAAILAKAPADQVMWTWRASLAGTVDEDASPTEHDGFALWQPFPPRRDDPDGEPKIWRASRLLGYGDKPEPRNPEPAQQFATQPDRTGSAAAQPDILVFDDAGISFRTNGAPDLLEASQTAAGYVLLKMSEPLADGPLWNTLATSYSNRLVCLVSARDLRREKIGLGRGLSWEASLEDLRVALDTPDTMGRLLSCRHLIVTFATDAALWLDLSNRAMPVAHFCFDPVRAEGEWDDQFEGAAFGFHCAMAGALAHGLANHSGPTYSGLNLVPAIKAGLVAMRDLIERGHGEYSRDKKKIPETNGYPIERIATLIAKHLSKDESSPDTGPFFDHPLDWPAVTGTPTAGWSIVESVQQSVGKSLFDLAVAVAKDGTAALRTLPRAKFGKLLTAERGEIETLRHIRQCMRSYRDDLSAKRPLSIGVFGPPGAGKSFGIRQLADEVFGEKSWREFNFSQFRNEIDLNGAYHQLRDLALSGLTPVVLWDEFDSRKLFWLQYLLAPMQDGRFQDGQLNHAIGKAVFIFAGGTETSLARFGKSVGNKADDFTQSKGPDFISRLDAHLNVLGPNKNTATNDPSFYLRRALLIRAYLGFKGGEKVDFDPKLLHALLAIDKYLHGARSMEKLISALRAGNPRVIRASNLPRPEQLAMHVDADAFADLMRSAPKMPVNRRRAIRPRAKT